MEPLDNYVEIARRLTRLEFAAKFPHLFLLKHPQAGGASGPITFRTQSLRLGAHGLIEETGSFAEDCWIWAVKKKPSNPFPERVSIGRATNCDVVMRLSYVSKLHAHLVTHGPSHELVDQGSANGSFVNARRLAPQESVVINVHDEIGIGSLKVELLDAPNLYDWLVRAAA